MSRVVRLLCVEDSSEALQAIEARLRQAGWQVVLRPVKTLEAFADALEREPWDGVLANYALAQFSALDALRLLQGQKRDLPFILVSGPLGEATAVAAMKAGVHDCLLRDDLGRLPGVLERELRAAALRRERVRVEEARARLEAQVRQVQKAEAIRLLAGGIAHDFNNILAAILGHAELLRSDLEPEHPGQESLQEILSASHRAKELVQQILLLSRRREEGRRRMALAPVVQEAVRLLRASLPASTEIHCDLPAPSPSIVGDPAQVHQVLLNLGAHASRVWHQAGARLTLRLDTVALSDGASVGAARAPGPYARISLHYAGEALPEASLERLFNLPPTPRPATEGPGLSLAVVHGIVQSHDGFIEVLSEPGRGTIVQVYFPAVEVETPTPAEPASEPPRGQGEHILVVDDEEAIARLAVTLLERLGYRVTAVTSPLEALAVVRADPAAVDLVVTDLTMPQMSGTDLARQLRQVRSELPVVLATGYRDALEPEQIQAADIQELVGKPFHTLTLAGAVWRALQEGPAK